MRFPHGQPPYFLDPKMRLLRDRPPPSPLLPPEPVEALLRQNRLRAVEPSSMTSANRYKREDDIPMTVITRALKALEGLADIRRARD